MRRHSKPCPRAQCLTAVLAGVAQPCGLVDRCAQWQLRCMREWNNCAYMALCSSPMCAAPAGESAEDARGAAALRTAVGNLRALHAYARRLASDALQQGVALIAQEDLSLLAGLAQELERMA